MTALRKYLPCDHKDQFHVDRFDAFLTFIDALNAPVPDIFARENLYGLFLIGLSPKPSRKNRTKTVAVPATTGDGT